MFSINHITWLAFIAIGILIFTIISVKCKFSFSTVANFLFVISLASELIKITTNIIPNPSGTGFILQQNAIPLHLCSIMIFIYLSLPFMSSGKILETAKSFVTVIGLLGATVALLIPINGTSFTKLITYQYFIYHGSMIYFSIYLIATRQVNLKLRAYFTNLVLIFFLLIIMIWVNSALNIYDTNFFFIVRPPMENLPLLNLDNGWHAYFLTLLGLGFITITLFHLPSIIKE